MNDHFNDYLHSDIESLAPTSHPRSLLLKHSGEGLRGESAAVRLLRIQAQTIARCRAVQARCKTQLVFALDTALKLLCVETPQELPGGDDLVVVVPTRSKRRRIAGVRCICWNHPLHCIDVDGLRCVVPEDTWLMYASRVDLRVLVMLGDAMTRRDAEVRWFDHSGLDQAYWRLQKESESSHRRLPCSNDKCRLALTLMRENTDSMRETELRLLLVSHGLPTPQVNLQVQVVDDRSIPVGPQGEKQKRTYYLDLAYPNLKVAIEYDGRQHAQNWESDMRRRTLLENDGWICINATWQDLTNEQARYSFANAVAARVSQRLGREFKIHECYALEKVAKGLERKASQQQLKQGKAAKNGDK
ncbi:MAG: DUF559 domain-containing protein [Bifidobacteriaceae bacterium]|nr:DUF559 domain-containing protein [Bifidobacteriaceae bacterium]